MTREQVLINHIQEYLDSGMWQYEACYLNKNDLKVIIKALAQEPCEDCISRKAVLDVIEREEFKGDAISEIEKLSSVIPQPKTGHWINEILPLPLSDGSKECVRCSNCGLHYDDVSYYCPNCGAKMEEADL